MIANFISQCNIVDEVLLIVNRQNPLKENPTVASEKERIEMARLVAKKCSKVRVSDIEMKLPLPSCTIDTLTLLKQLYPEHNFKLIIGSDSLINFNRWKESDRILKEFGLIVYPRPGFPCPGNEKDTMTFLTGAPEFSISSSLVREYVASGWNINYFVPVEVADYIKEKKLYHE